MSATKILTTSKPTVSLSNGDSSKSKSTNGEDECPICKNTSYISPDMKLLVSECYHEMCENCIDRLFANGAGPCPICNQIIRKVNFMKATFQDLRVEKEVNIRKKWGMYFNKRQEDFETLKEFNDYQEEVEEIIWNLIDGIDVEETKERIQKYRQKNQDSFLKNKEKEKTENELEKRKSEKEKLEKARQWEAYQKSREEEEMFKKKRQIGIIDALATSNSDASQIVAAEKAATAAQLNLLRSQDSPLNMLVLQKSQTDRSDSGIGSDIKEDDLMHEDYNNSLDDSSILYTLKDKYNDPYTEITSLSKAGGFSLKFVHEKALQAAFSSLLLSPIDGDGDVIMS